MTKTIRRDFGEDLRQQQYLMKIRAYYQGRAPRYWIQTYGCQMNENDSEKLAGLLTSAGFSPAPSLKEANVILLNTCCVREHAELKVFGNVGALRALKEANPQILIGICGCMMQQREVAHKLARRYPYVDIIFGTHHVCRFPQLMWEAIEGRHTVVKVDTQEGEVVENLPIVRKAGCKAWISIMYGCDNFCSYCIVPYVRGRERSRLPEDILHEAEGLAADGVREITLLGQNVNSYGKNLEKPLDFAGLLRQLHAVDGIERIRFMTSHPKDLSEALMQVMGELPKVCHHLHLPVQSGSDRILAKMNRRYDRAHYIDLVRRLRERVPDISLTTDIIVGFPGETEEDFADTLKLVESVRFDAAYTFLYSPREGTPAAAMEAQIPLDTKKERLARLNALQDAISSENNAACLGQVFPVLVEDVSIRNPRELNGRTSTGRMVHFEGSPEWIGQILPIEITTVKAHTLSGRVKK